MAQLDKKDLRLFIRVDNQGRRIAGSDVFRKNPPKNGTWREIRAEQCCDPWFDKTTSTTTTSTTSSSTTSTTTTSASDMRLKFNIVLTGNKIGSLNEYSWEWNSVASAIGVSHHRTTGVMAQEALLVYPDAVFMAEDGYYRVDYSKIV